MATTATQALGLVALLMAVLPNASANEIELPADTTRLQKSELPGYALAQQKCGICHSADYIHYQPPGMTQAQWTAEMSKMAHSYGAPLDDEEIALIGAYLAVTYGSATATDASIVSLTSAATESAKQSDSASAGDNDEVQALLKANACLGCHALDQTVVGPAFKDVADKYRGRASAQSLVATSIRQGGAGKWGTMAMPAMPGLDDQQAMALAKYVLQQ